jgi:hypothetical protein
LNIYELFLLKFFIALLLDPIGSSNILQNHHIWHYHFFYCNHYYCKLIFLLYILFIWYFYSFNLLFVNEKNLEDLFINFCKFFVSACSSNSIHTVILSYFKIASFKILDKWSYGISSTSCNFLHNSMENLWLSVLQHKIQKNRKRKLFAWIKSKLRVPKWLIISIINVIFFELEIINI